jgi:nitroreductase
MTLTLVAGNRGYVSCPIGFDPIRVNNILGRSDRYMPVMMFAVGRPSLGNTARRPRLSVDDVLAFNVFREF